MLYRPLLGRLRIPKPFGESVNEDETRDVFGISARIKPDDQTAISAFSSVGQTSLGPADGHRPRRGYSTDTAVAAAALSICSWSIAPNFVGAISISICLSVPVKGNGDW